MDLVTLTTIISLFNLGFFGGFSHCLGMCGPFVLTQVMNKLTTTPLEEYQGLRRLQNLALLPYHFGRITTYSFVGFCCSFLAGNLADFTIFKEISAVFLFIAATIFLGLFLQNIGFATWQNSKLKKYFAKIDFVRVLMPHQIFTKLKLSKFLNQLFQNPKGLNGYFLGIILGFIPCGLLYAAFVLAASLSSPFYAALGMFAFGLATVPALFTSAIFSGFFFCKIIKPKLEFVANLVLLINAIILFLMALGLILK